MESVLVGVKRISRGVVIYLSHPIQRGFGVETFVSFKADIDDSTYELICNSIGLSCMHSRPYKGYVNIYLDKIKKG